MKKYARVKIENNEPVWNSSKGEEQFPKLFNWYSIIKILKMLKNISWNI